MQAGHAYTPDRPWVSAGRGIVERPPPSFDEVVDAQAAAARASESGPLALERRPIALP